RTGGKQEAPVRRRIPRSGAVDVFLAPVGTSYGVTRKHHVRRGIAAVAGTAKCDGLPVAPDSSKVPVRLCTVERVALGRTVVVVVDELRHGDSFVFLVNLPVAVVVYSVVIDERTLEVVVTKGGWRTAITHGTIIEVIAVVDESHTQRCICSNEVVCSVTQVRVGPDAEVGVGKRLVALVKQRVLVEGCVIERIGRTEGKGRDLHFQAQRRRVRPAVWSSCVVHDEPDRLIARQLWTV